MDDFETAKALWKLLDDIDTLGDSMKPEITPYFRKVNEIAAKRHKLLTSDGYELTRPGEPMGACSECHFPRGSHHATCSHGSPVV